MQATITVFGPAGGKKVSRKTLSIDSDLSPVFDWARVQAERALKEPGDSGICASVLIIIGRD